MDIVCEGSGFLLYLEIKIDSFEHAAQTERYRKRLLLNAAGRQSELIYLSPGSAPLCKEARHISWLQVASIADELAYDSPNEFVSELLRQYACFTRRF